MNLTIIAWGLTEARADPPVLMVYGDSLVAGHGLAQGKEFPSILYKQLKDDGIEVTMINSGVSGETTAGARSRLNWALEAKPDAVILVLGGNDMLRGLDPQASYENLDFIITHIKNRGAKVLLAGMQAPKNFGSDYSDEFDSIYTRLAVRHKILLYPFFLDGVALVVDLNQSDGMHPNEAGINVIVNKILPNVRELLAQIDR